MKKKNWFLIIIILAAVLLIATVIWIYAKRIEHIESKMKISTISVRAKLLLPIWAPSGGKSVTLFWLRGQTTGQRLYTFILEITLFFGRELNTAKAESWSIYIVSGEKKLLSFNDPQEILEAEIQAETPGIRKLRLFICKHTARFQQPFIQPIIVQGLQSCISDDTRCCNQSLKQPELKQTNLGTSIRFTL